MTRKGSTVRRTVHRFTADEDEAAVRVRSDSLATEEPLEIRIARSDVRGSRIDPTVAHRIAVTMRTPGADFDLVAGFLFTERIIERAEALEAIRYCTDAEHQQYNVVTAILTRGTAFEPASMQRNFYTTSSCGVCGKASIEAVLGPTCTPVEGTAAIGAATLLGLPEQLRSAQTVFERTGGLHAAALFSTGGEMVRLREDVGRHNAMDKLVGASLLAAELPWTDRVVFVSGRLSFELVQKAARAGVSILAGVSAPSSLAVELAEQAGITLAGFVRGERFNVYTGRERIIGVRTTPEPERG